MKNLHLFKYKMHSRNPTITMASTMSLEPIGGNHNKKTEQAQPVHPAHWPRNHTCRVVQWTRIHQTKKPEYNYIQLTLKAPCSVVMVFTYLPYNFIDTISISQHISIQLRHFLHTDNIMICFFYQKDNWPALLHWGIDVGSHQSFKVGHLSRLRIL